MLRALECASRFSPTPSQPKRTADCHCQRYTQPYFRVQFESCLPETLAFCPRNVGFQRPVTVKKKKKQPGMIRFALPFRESELPSRQMSVHFGCVLPRLSAGHQFNFHEHSRNGLEPNTARQTRLLMCVSILSYTYYGFNNDGQGFSMLSGCNNCLLFFF